MFNWLITPNRATMYKIIARGDFEGYFHLDLQEYFVYYKGKLLIRGKYRYRDIAAYFDNQPLFPHLYQ